jgi:hypothetical protein
MPAGPARGSNPGHWLGGAVPRLLPCGAERPITPVPQVSLLPQLTGLSVPRCLSESVSEIPSGINSESDLGPPIPRRSAAGMPPAPAGGGDGSGGGGRTDERAGWGDRMTKGPSGDGKDG